MNYPPDRRRRTWHDRAVPIASAIAVITIIVFGSLTYANYRELKHDDARRINDLQQACRSSSARSAVQASLDWTYYRSEILLTRRPARPAPIPSHLDPSSRAILRYFTEASRTNIKILRARAVADFNGAWAQSQSVDIHDAGLIHVAPILGGPTTVQRWVLRNHFDCRQAFGPVN